MDRRWVLATALLLSACSLLREPPQTTFQRQEDAGSVHVAVQSVAPFDEYIASLQPKFTLTTDQALSQAVAQTQAQDTAALRSLVASLQLTLPAAATPTPAPAPAAASSTPAPAPSPAPTPAPAPGTASFALPAASVDLDPSLKFRAAAALLQEVTLLNNYVRDAAVRTHTQPYIVRLLVTVFPTARDEPYDVYSTVSFFKGSQPPVSTPAEKIELNDFLRGLGFIGKPLDETCDGHPLEVIPLFVTDNLESSLHTHTTQQLRSLSTQVSGVAPNFSGNLGADVDANDGGKTLGRDLNSIFTVAKLSTNTLESRMGAIFTNGRQVMITRTYNVTALLLVPTRSLFEGNAILPQCRNVTFSAQSAMRDARTGRLLPQISPGLIKERIRSIVESVGLTYDSTHETEYYDLVWRADFDDFQNFRIRIKSVAPPNTADADITHLALALWPEFARLTKLTGRSRGSFEVPLLPNARIFPDSLGTSVLDDGKQARFTVSGGRNLTEERLSASLIAINGSDQLELPASSIKVDSDHMTATFFFPSVKKILFKAAKDAVNDIKIKQAMVELRSGDRPWQLTNTTQRWQQPAMPRSGTPPPVLTPPSLFGIAAAPDPKAEFALSVPSTYIRTDATGVGTLTIEIRSADGKGRTVGFNVEGGYITAVSAQTSSVPPVVLVGADRIATADGVYELTIKNLAPGSRLAINSFRKDGDDRIPGPSAGVEVRGPEKQSKEGEQPRN